MLDAHLDPYLGCLQSFQYAKPSLVYDIQELFHVVIEDFTVSYTLTLEPESLEQDGRRRFPQPQERVTLRIELTRKLRKKTSHTRTQHSKVTTI